MKILEDVSLSAIIAGLVALVATFSGPVLIVVGAAQAGGLSSSELSSWVWALCFGAGVLSLWFSVRHRIPVIGAWSTPGVALLTGSLANYSYPEVIGCYLFLATIIGLLAWLGLFSAVMRRIPLTLLSAVIAGVLFNFCEKIFTAIGISPLLAIPIIVAYVLFRRIFPRYAIAIALLVGLLLAISNRQDGVILPTITLVSPVFTSPAFNLSSLLSLGVPLTLLALSQYATGVAVLQREGFDVSSKKLVGGSAILSIPLALFGSSGINPAAIVGALCAGNECHPDRTKRYVSGIVAGIGYIFLGLFSTYVVAIFTSLPSAVIAVLTGLALLSTLVGSLVSVVEKVDEREPAIVTFLVTASGVSYFSVSPALLGLALGMLYLFVLRFRHRVNDGVTS